MSFLTAVFKKRIYHMRVCLEIPPYNFKSKELDINAFNNFSDEDKVKVLVSLLLDVYQESQKPQYNAPPSFEFPGYQQDNTSPNTYVSQPLILPTLKKLPMPVVGGDRK